MSKRIVIHRGPIPWFEFKGQRYEIHDTAPSTRRGPDADARRIVRVNSDVPGDYEDADEGFMYYSEIRAMLARAVAEDWPSLIVGEDR